ncbi:hypothetical protein [[Kitasatospora] papulosa]|uniref:hypothetical protein n=1 Tax=[Kitasatospora] papulosa TaxID=1464011 RepID=UPI00362A842B
MSRTIPLLVLSLFALLSLLVAAASTVRAYMLAQSSAAQARAARQQAVSHWVGALLVTGVTVIVRIRQPDAGSGADRPSWVPMPWRTLGLVAGGLGAAVVVAAVLAVRVRAWRRRHDHHRKAQQSRRMAQERIESVAVRHGTVLEEYGAYLVDFLAALEHPALNDPSVAETERFDRARIDADDARIAVRHGEGGGPIGAYHKAVAELEVSWRIARDHAQRIGTSYLQPAVSRRLAKAADLMAVVRDGSTEHERALAYQRVRRLVGTSVRIPQLAELAVEYLVRPALTAGGLDAVVRANRAVNVALLEMRDLS